MSQLRHALAGSVALLTALVASSCSDQSAELPAAGAQSGSLTATPGASPRQQVEKYLEDQAAFVECLRENGLPDTKDPDELGVVIVDFDDPAIEDALSACGSLGTRRQDVPVEIMEKIEEREAAQ